VAQILVHDEPQVLHDRLVEDAHEIRLRVGEVTRQDRDSDAELRELQRAHRPVQAHHRAAPTDALREPTRLRPDVVLEADEVVAVEVIARRAALGDVRA